MRSLLSAFLMYSRIPVPQVEWKEENRRYSLGFFPLVGAVIGGVLLLWRYLCGAFGFGQFVFAVGAVVIPVLVTGGIHLDGFCDVTDARSSFADMAKRLEILADPHIGSFAVIYLCLYLLAQTALFSELHTVKECIPAACGYVVSRGLSAVSAVCFKAAKKEGTLQSFVKPSHRTVTIAMAAVFAALAGAAAVAVSLMCGCAALMAAGFAVLYCRSGAYKSFGGYTGDVCGWFLQICELWYLAAYAAALMIGRSV